MLPPKDIYLPISELHSILALANFVAHNKISQLCYCGQILLQRIAVNCSFSYTFGGNFYFAGDVTYILLIGLAPKCEFTIITFMNWVAQR